ncbi:MAG: hypothetical protein AB1374_02600 [Bacillota bacterium]
MVAGQEKRFQFLLFREAFPCGEGPVDKVDVEEHQVGCGHVPSERREESRAYGHRVQNEKEKKGRTGRHHPSASDTGQRVRGR